MKRAAGLFGLGLLSACAAPTPPAPSPAPVVVTRPAPAPAPPPATVPPRDQCGAAALQNLVGRPRTEIPVPVLPGARRVTCTTCPVTMDYLPGRLNILFDAETGIVREVKCG